MLQITPGTIIYSSRHNCLLRCFGRNGGRPEQHLGHVVVQGKVDRETCRIFTAPDVAAVKEGKCLRYVLPGTVARVYDLPKVESWLDGLIEQS